MLICRFESEDFRSCAMPARAVGKECGMSVMAKIDRKKVKNDCSFKERCRMKESGGSVMLKKEKGSEISGEK